MTPQRLAEIQARFKANGTLARGEAEDLLKWAATRHALDGARIVGITPIPGSVVVVRASTHENVGALNALAEGISKMFAPAMVVVLGPGFDLNEMSDADLLVSGLQRIPPMTDLIEAQTSPA